MFHCVFCSKQDPNNQSNIKKGLSSRCHFKLHLSFKENTQLAFGLKVDLILGYLDRILTES